MPFGRVSRCKEGCCKVEAVDPWIAAILVVSAATASLASPFLKAAGISDMSGLVIYNGGDIIRELALGGSWILSVVLGVTRSHENALFCFVDSVGIPAILQAIISVAGGH